MGGPGRAARHALGTHGGSIQQPVGLQAPTGCCSQNRPQVRKKSESVKQVLAIINVVRGVEFMYSSLSCRLPAGGFA